MSGAPHGTAGPPHGWPGASTDCLPRPQSIPRAPSSDEECFFDLLSKFQSSRMDDQRCPLEDGQPAAAEATATPTLEGRVGESAPTPLQAPRAGQASCKVPPVTGSPGLQSSETCHPPVPQDTLVVRRAGVGGRGLWPPPTGGPPSRADRAAGAWGWQRRSRSLGGAPASPA